MAFDLLIDSPTFTIPSVKDLEKQWVNVPGSTVRTVIAREHQYLFLHVRLLDQLYFTDQGKAASPLYKKPIDYNLRAGFVKAALLMAASICEAVLRAHAEKRKLPLNPKKKMRTFGNVLQAWKGNPDVASLWADLDDLRDMRNNIHLFVAAGSSRADYRQIIAAEKAMLTTARKLVGELMKLVSP